MRLSVIALLAFVGSTFAETLTFDHMEDTIFSIDSETGAWVNGSRILTEGGAHWGTCTGKSSQCLAPVRLTTGECALRPMAYGEPCAYVNDSVSFGSCSACDFYNNCNSLSSSKASVTNVELPEVNNGIIYGIQVERGQWMEGDELKRGTYFAYLTYQGNQGVVIGHCEGTECTNIQYNEMTDLTGQPRIAFRRGYLTPTIFAGSTTSYTRIARHCADDLCTEYEDVTITNTGWNLLSFDVTTDVYGNFQTVTAYTTSTTQGYVGTVLHHRCVDPECHSVVETVLVSNTEHAFSTAPTPAIGVNPVNNIPFIAYGVTNPTWAVRTIVCDDPMCTTNTPGFSSYDYISTSQISEQWVFTQNGTAILASAINAVFGAYLYCESATSCSDPTIVEVQNPVGVSFGTSAQESNEVMITDDGGILFVILRRGNGRTEVHVRECQSFYCDEFVDAVYPMPSIGGSPSQDFFTAWGWGFPLWGIKNSNNGWLGAKSCN